jgi:hypothetical protein
MGNKNESIFLWMLEQERQKNRTQVLEETRRDLAELPDAPDEPPESEKPHTKEDKPATPEEGTDLERLMKEKESLESESHRLDEEQEKLNLRVRALCEKIAQQTKKKNSEKFISKNFLGYSFFHSGYTADYEASGKKFKIFVIEGKDQEDCRMMMEKYLNQTGSEGQKPSEGTYRLKDKYHGEVDIFWKGKFIWGILDLNDSSLRDQYLQKLKS